MSDLKNSNGEVEPGLIRMIPIGKTGLYFHERHPGPHSRRSTSVAIHVDTRGWSERAKDLLTFITYLIMDQDDAGIDISSPQYANWAESQVSYLRDME